MSLVGGGRKRALDAVGRVRSTAGSQEKCHPPPVGYATS